MRIRDEIMLLGRVLPRRRDVNTPREDMGNGNNPAPNSEDSEYSEYAPRGIKRGVLVI